MDPGICYSCMVKLSDNEYLVLGGCTNSKEIRDVFKYEYNKQKTHKKYSPLKYKKIGKLIESK